MADTKLTREKLDALRDKAKKLLAAQKRQVLVCAGTGCIASGSMKVYDYLNIILLPFPFFSSFHQFITTFLVILR